MISPTDKEWIRLTPRQKIQRVCEVTGLAITDLGTILQTTHLETSAYFQNKRDLPPRYDHIFRLLADLHPGNGELQEGKKAKGGNIWELAPSHTLLGLEVQRARYDGKQRREHHLQGTRIAMDLAERIYDRIRSDEFLSKTMIVKVESFFDRERYRGEVLVRDLNPKGTGRWVTLVITEEEVKKKGDCPWKIGISGLRPDKSPFPYHYTERRTVNQQRLEVLADIAVRFVAPWISAVVL